MKKYNTGLGNGIHVDVSILYFKPSSEQVKKILNSFYNFLKKVPLNSAQMVVLIVNDCVDRQLIEELQH